MEILINGRAVNDPKLLAAPSFTDLMTEINRVVNSREEIITDVQADGKSIEEWDSPGVDLAGISRLDILSLPARDYAIASLGDLGDYTGEVLSVLRNFENICRKDGFEMVRNRLVEGLDYITTVIETSGNVLRLNLAQARYDARSGEQMLKELKSLKSRVQAAADFASSKSVFENLEFTLTDWLKFLETLLRRYGDKQAEIGSPEEVLEEVNSKIQSLNQLESDIKSIVDDLYAGKIAKSLDQFQSKILTLQSSLAYIQRLNEYGRVRYQTLAVNNEKLADKIPQIVKILKELSDSIQVGDSVLMRDLLEYEVLPFVSFLRQIYGLICTSDDSSKLS